MADISKITLPNSDTYNLKDSSAARIDHKHHFRDFEPLQYKEYTGVYSEQDNDTYGYKFYGRIKPTSYKALWYVRLHIVAYVPNSADYYGDYIFEMNGMRSTYSTYSCYNAIQNTDYRPIYYTTLRFASNEANTNSYGHLIGTYLRNCANYTNASYARTIRIEVLETENCEFEFFDSYKIYSQVPGTGSFNGNNNFNHYSAGLQETGDADTTPNGNNYYRATTDSVGIQQNSFVMEGPNNTIGSIATTSSTSTTNKICNPNGFRVGGEIMWYNSGNVAANTELTQAWRGFYSLWASYLDFRYSSNCGTTLTPNSSLYLVGTIRDNLFYLDTPWWTTTPPTTDDGKIYILIGNTYSNYQINLFQKKLWMHFKDGVFKEYVPAHKHTASDVTGLSTVATTGSYNDLSNKPSIPSAVTETTVSGWGFTKNTGTYSKPSGGIPKTDLASSVQTSLGKADTALQSYTETDPIFSASAAAGIKSTDITNWNGKQNAITSSNKLDYSLVANAPRYLTDMWLPRYANGTPAVFYSLVDNPRANKLAFIPSKNIIIEQTTDGGSTWTSGGYNDVSKASLFAKNRPSIAIPLDPTTHLRQANCGVRVTITGMNYDVPEGTAETQKYSYWNKDHVLSTERYCSMNVFYFWVSSNDECIGLKIETATGAASNNWVTRFDSDAEGWRGLTGWSGDDIVTLSSGNQTFGGGTNQTDRNWNWRFTFFSRPTEFGQAMKGATSAQYIYDIRGYGSSLWTSANNLMAFDHLYNYDINQNATFPARVTATGFTGDLNGTASNASKVNNHTVDKDVPSNAEFTDTQADWNATSGKAQILNKPTIPTAVTESTVSGWGFTKNTGTYSKPSTGIPKTDLASAVQTSLGKADSALQSYTETDPVFSASPAAGITSANITSWNNKGTYSKPSGGIPASDLADTYLKSYTETDPVFSASAAAGITSTNISTWNSKGTYSKPSGGIPKTDLASAVQTSLGKADSALQSFTETDPVFSASAAAGITSSNITAWNNKQDAITSSNKLDYSLLSGTPTIPAATPIATTSTAGKVKPDGTTITVDSDGTIHSVGGGGGGTVVVTHAEITLSASSWSNNEQSASIGAFNANTTNFVVSPNGNSFESYSESMIRAISYDSPNLKFKAKTVPSNDITVNVMIVREA